MRYRHIPALLKESIDCLDVRKGRWYIDATLGGGGHTREILRRGGRVLGIDMDIASIQRAKGIFRREIAKGVLVVKHGNFRNVEELALSEKRGPYFGILYDLGVSSYQLEDLSRGFSLNSNFPLDMRMNMDLKVSARDLVNGLTRRELEKLLLDYGGEGNATKIAAAIVKSRGKKPIKTCRELANIIKNAVGQKKEARIHPATKTFQALRIAVNDELESLNQSLPCALRVLQSGGRIVVISFHSLEDRIVKEFGRDNKLVRVLTKKPIIPSNKEIESNPRVRSAKLRVFEKI